MLDKFGGPLSIHEFRNTSSIKKTFTQMPQKLEEKVTKIYENVKKNTTSKFIFQDQHQVLPNTQKQPLEVQETTQSIQSSSLQKMFLN